MITTIIFDLDGTLLNTLDDLWASVNYSLAQNGLPCRSKSEVRSFLGNGVRVLIEKSVPEGTDKDIVEQVLSTFRPYYVAHAMDKTAPYDGVRAMLAKLKSQGYKTAIVSNKPDAAVQELYESMFKELIDIAIGERSDLRRKPCPDMVLKAMEQLGSSTDESIYVGDSEVDYATAQNSGLPCVSVSWGFRDKEFLESTGAKLIIDSPEEFLKLNL
jgi:phosphoglycolate phosphatase